jgi:surface polysaccharide O-acyltransferase-like enzyme
MPKNISPDLFWINALRVLSTFAVVVLHVSADVVLGVRDTTSLHWWIGNFSDSSVRWCVPIFVMVSGSLLLDPSKNESISVFFKKRAARILLPLVFWTLVYTLYLTKTAEFNLRITLLRILMGYPYPHLWYLYMLLGLYVVTPFLRTYVRSSSIRERYQLIFLIFSFASITAMIGFYTFKMTPTVFTLFIPYTGYYICGYQLRSVDKSRISVRLLCLVMSGCVLLTALGTGFTTNIYGLGKGLFFYEYFAPPVIVMSICLYLFLYKAFSGEKRMGNSIQILFDKIAPTTFGIYLIHLLLLGEAKAILGVSPTSFSPLLSIPLFSCGIFLFCYLIILAMIKIPYVRRVIA